MLKTKLLSLVAWADVQSDFSSATAWRNWKPSHLLIGFFEDSSYGWFLVSTVDPEILAVYLWVLSREDQCIAGFKSVAEVVAYEAAAFVFRNVDYQRGVRFTDTTVNMSLNLLVTVPGTACTGSWSQSGRSSGFDVTIKKDEKVLVWVSMYGSLHGKLMVLQGQRKYTQCSPNCTRTYPGKVWQTLQVSPVDCTQMYLDTVWRTRSVFPTDLQANLNQVYAVTEPTACTAGYSLVNPVHIPCRPGGEREP
ncbi:hypothetical protein KI387_000602, partial [Taxus chinensis]